MEQGPNKKDLNCVFVLSVLEHNVEGKVYIKDYKFMCTVKEERDMWISMFEFILAANKVQKADTNANAF